MTTESVFRQLKEIEHLRVGSEIRQWFFGKIVGWNVYANTLLRKRITMEEVQEEINARNLPLEIRDTFEFTDSFQVILKDVA